MRKILLSLECKEYIENNSSEIDKKFKYCLQILSEQKVIHSKLVKKLTNTKFYELRISTANEHRIILFTIDKSNLMEAQKIVLLNGFLKKSTKDYKNAIKIADKLLTKYKIDNNG